MGKRKPKDEMVRFLTSAAERTSIFTEAAARGKSVSEYLRTLHELARSARLEGKELRSIEPGLPEKILALARESADATREAQAAATAALEEVRDGTARLEAAYQELAAMRAQLEEKDREIAALRRGALREEVRQILLDAAAEKRESSDERPTDKPKPHSA